MDLRIGDRIPGNGDTFTLSEVLGSGAFGLVFKAADTTGKVVAVKTLVTAALDAVELSALLNEGRNLSQIIHPNVLRVLYFHDGRTSPALPPYIIMEYADGGTLADLIAKRSAAKEFLSPDEVGGMCRQLAEGMDAISAVFVHRDIKPDNVLVAGGNLKIADFGLSKLAAAATRSSTFKGINHFKYCAPEAWRLEKNSIQMDMYSMGIVFFEMACLQNPFEVHGRLETIEAWRQAHLMMVLEDPRLLNPSTPIKLAQVILKLTSKRPQDRYKSWQEVSTALRAGGPVATAPDVSVLVEKAVRVKQAEEALRAKAVAQTTKREERLGLVGYSFGVITSSAQQTVDAFNQASELAKLRLNLTGSHSFNIQVEGKPRAHVAAEIGLAPEGSQMLGKKIIAWGFIGAPSGRGINIILVAENADDVYGTWSTLSVTHSPLARQRDSRPEPFFFSIAELPSEIRHLNAIHIYQTQVGPFVREQLDPLIAELL